MDKQREIFVSEIERMEDACRRTKSEYLKRDYQKAIKRMKKELNEYDGYKTKTHSC